mmetsp:Transcript_125151/g.348244  ORF Transcript_125151/g.348244 Transcript_125151/m.348244 type:complete len:218 (-) Transcript_125151:457-1110(-)
MCFQMGKSLTSSPFVWWMYRPLQLRWPFGVLTRSIRDTLRDGNLPESSEGDRINALIIRGVSTLSLLPPPPRGDPGGLEGNGILGRPTGFRVRLAPSPCASWSNMTVLSPCRAAPSPSRGGTDWCTGAALVLLLLRGSNSTALAPSWWPRGDRGTVGVLSGINEEKHEGDQLCSSSPMSWCFALPFNRTIQMLLSSLNCEPSHHFHVPLNWSGVMQP